MDTTLDIVEGMQFDRGYLSPYLVTEPERMTVELEDPYIFMYEKKIANMKTGLKAYRYLSEGVELMQELGVELDEAELVRCNSTGLTIYNPQNLASMIKGMKNTTMTREQKIALRKEYEKKQSVN